MPVFLYLRVSEAVDDGVDFLLGPTLGTLGGDGGLVSWNVFLPEYRVHRQPMGFLDGAEYGGDTHQTPAVIL